LSLDKFHFKPLNRLPDAETKLWLKFDYNRMNNSRMNTYKKKSKMASMVILFSEFWAFAHYGLVAAAALMLRAKYGTDRPYG